VLKMESVSKQYLHRGKNVTALDNVTLEIPRGDYVSVVGPSGSGKSTLLLMLGGMLSPGGGRVWVDGHCLYDLTPEERASLRKEKIGFVFQTFNLVPYLTAMENVQIPLVLAGVNEGDQKKRAASLLERMGLDDRLDHKPSELSVGQQQRVALARMLANDPTVILADEPTGNLDPATSQAILDFIDELNGEGKTIVMVTHDLRAAQRARRTLRLGGGKIIAGEPEAVELPEAVRPELDSAPLSA
jgi:putative ABC transport system ATP-binding protein